MAYIPGFTYDIFISYAHLDNEKLSGQTEGWIEQFYKDLNILLSRSIGSMDSIKIWWDSKKLDGGKLFDESIKEGINRSAILLCLTSTSWLKSLYCKNELAHFYEKATVDPAGLKIKDRSRILNVLLNNIPYSEWPEAMSGTTGFPFYDAVDKDDKGDPLDAGTPRFRLQLQALRDAIVQLINEFPKTENTPASLETKEAKTASDKFTIYMGEVADTLRAARKRTIIELEKKGYNIVYGIPPPDEAASHKAKVKETLEKADLSVHMLDQIPGREILGAEDSWYPQTQAELGLQFAKSKVVWVPDELDIPAVEEEKYRLFLQGLEGGKGGHTNFEFIRGSKSNLTQVIIETAEQIKEQQRQSKKPANGKVSVLLDTNYKDQLHAFDLSKLLVENEIQPFINPQDDDPLKNINQLEERISQVSKLIFFYGAVSGDWVNERIKAAMQLIITKNLPIEELFIFLDPPLKDPRDISLKQKFLKVDVINNSGNPLIVQEHMQDFLKKLKGTAL